MKTIPHYCCLIMLLLCSQTISAQKIKVYFNHPVNTSVSSGVNATYLNQAIDDTLIAYISRAHYSIDIAVYNFVQSGNMSNIAAAINTAYDNGIKIRWIYNGSSSNSGLSLINSAIPTLQSPTGSAYGIMHNKFMIIDAYSADPNDAIVWTGSCNWDAEQFNTDVNNVIIFQDSSLAHAYTQEFNEMWGDTGMVVNTALSKFGPYKSNNTQHLFNIGGTLVEQYFSPSDHTDSHIVQAISSANDDLYFGVYTFTEIPEADSIVSKFQNQGVYTAGIIDQYSQSFTPYSILNPVLANQFKVYNQSSSIYHNKMMIADPCSKNSDPLVETGSHNWTVSADTKNDENALIIHNDTIANLYYQSFYQNFLDLGGSLVKCSSVLALNDIEMTHFMVYPNPAEDQCIIQNPLTQNIDAVLSNSFGQTVQTIQLHPGVNSISVNRLLNGLYFIRIVDAQHAVNQKLLVQH